MNQRLDLKSQTPNGDRFRTEEGCYLIYLLVPFIRSFFWGVSVVPWHFEASNGPRSQGDPGKPGLLWRPPRATDEQLSGGPVVSQLCDSRGWPQCRHLVQKKGALEEENENRSCKE